MKKRMKKGFTLIEMVIVVVIIGILTAVLIPTWNYFITQSRITSQNNNSRVIFNAAQTECIKQKFKIRELRGEITTLEKQLPIQKTNYANKLADLANISKNPGETQEDFEKRRDDLQAQVDDLKNGIEKNEQTLRDDRASIYLADYIQGAEIGDDIFKDFYFYWNGSSGFSCDENLAPLAGKTDELDKAFADAIIKAIETPDEVVFKLHIKDYKVVSVISAKGENDRNIGSYPVQQDSRSSKTIRTFNFADAEK